MSLSTATATAICALFFNATAWADMAENDSSSPLATIPTALHTADPGVGGNQTTNELGYTSYARITPARTSGGFTCTANVASPTATLSFPEGTGGSGTATHMSHGHLSSGAGVILISGTLTPNIVCGLNITPQIATSTTATFT